MRHVLTAPPNRRSKAAVRRVVLSLAVAASLSCSHDPVPQEEIDSLPPEDADGPSEFHRQGQPCVLCHSEYEGADPPLAIGGTVYEQNTTTFQLIPVEGVFVTVFDSAGASQKACTNAAGNFLIRLEDYPEAAFPLTVRVGNRFMRGLIGRERSCAGCHELASVSRVEQDPSVDTSTGAGRDSAGAVLVERATVPSEEQCGPHPAAASVGSGPGPMGGSGGTGAGDGSGGAGGNE
jgi:hypothetical protein